MIIYIDIIIQQMYINLWEIYVFNVLDYLVKDNFYIGGVFIIFLFQINQI